MSDAPIIVRCDGGGNKCSYCISHNIQCTYAQPIKKRGPQKKYLNVDNVEITTEKMRTLIKRHPELLKELEELDQDPRASETIEQSHSLPIAKVAATVPMSPVNPEADEQQSSDEDVPVTRDLTTKLSDMHIQPMTVGYLGKSSSIVMLHKAYAAKQDFAGTKSTKSTLMQRNQMWARQPWANPALEPLSERRFPPADLLERLIDLFFTHINNYNPLLFRPLFDQQIAEGLHLRDERFGAVVLLVCATASKFCDDPRVLLEETESKYSAGWKYFRQVQVLSNRLLATPSLLDVQIIVLAVFFLQSLTAPAACWSLIGLGLRMALDVGAHRRKTYKSLDMQKEMWKRVFWILVNMDHTLAMFLGRPTAVRDEDIDVDLPIECDDEFWVTTEDGVRPEQPSGKPSRVTFFNSSIRLTQILGYALRTLYSIKKSKILLGLTGPQWQQNIVAELDSALNQWIESVPDHLRWDPHRENELFLNQSALLYAKYYQLQITIHRPFISTPSKPSPLSSPSLTICTNAARSTIHVMEHKVLFQAGVVLLLNIWGGRRTGLNLDPHKEMADVQKCISMLTSMGERWPSAGRLGAILCEFANMSDFPLPQDSISPGHSPKRGRDTESSGVIQAPSSSTAPRGRTPVNGSHEGLRPIGVYPDTQSFSSSSGVPLGTRYSSTGPSTATSLAFVSQSESSARFMVPTQFEDQSNHYDPSVSDIYVPPTTSMHTTFEHSAANEPSTSRFDFPDIPLSTPSQPNQPSAPSYSMDPSLNSSDGFGFNHQLEPTGIEGLTDWFNNSRGFSWDNWEMLMGNAFPEAHYDETALQLPLDPDRTNNLQDTNPASLYGH
ncbi:hypothetical protein K474DRAFT_1704230 [Panus rudis PR-1116 ss-1]|nr:hypothetical protein K474DRAFT_1704230 [Panus rudis PR-1116 ss-1]